MSDGEEYEGAERSVQTLPQKDNDRRGRKVQLKVRLSPSEADRFRRICGEYDLTGCAVVRKWIDGQALPDPAIRELRRQGGLLKHTAFGLDNRGALTKGEKARMLEYAASLFEIAARLESYDK